MNNPIVDIKTLRTEKDIKRFVRNDRDIHAGRYNGTCPKTGYSMAFKKVHMYELAGEYNMTITSRLNGRRDVEFTPR